MPSKYAIEKAMGAWSSKYPLCRNIVVDSRLAFAFASIIDKVVKEYEEKIRILKLFYEDSSIKNE